MKVESESEVAQLCPTPSDPMDCSPPGSSIRGIFQAIVLEWGAIAFSCQIKERSRHAAEKEAFLSCGAHILRSTSLEFSIVEAVFGFQHDII